MVNRPKQLRALAPLLALLLMGCDETDGIPSGNPTPSAAQSASPNPSEGGDVFAGLDECEILDTALEGEGFEPGKINDKFKSIQPCAADKLTNEPCTADSCRYDRMVAVQIDLAFQQRAFDQMDLDTERTHKGDVNGREAVMIKDPAEREFGIEGGCMIIMRVGASHYALVVGGLAGGRDADKDCKIVDQVAKRVEPQLPQVGG
ncbi:MAG: DUF3558 domain-containing protein [Actinophytocola sp.]|nr:DUF3558 domain-containing protein [Actinophytocola sp.]